MKRLLASMLGLGVLATAIPLAYSNSSSAEATNAAANEVVNTAQTTQSACAGVKVGPEQIVVSDAKRDELGLKAWADTAFGVLPDGNGNYKFLSVAALANSKTHNQSIAVTRGTLDNPVAGGVAKMAGVANMPAGYVYTGGGPVYRDPATGVVLQTLHLERTLAGGGYYSELHLGRFDPVNNTTTYLGQLAAPDLDFDTANAKNWSADVGTSSLSVKDGYLRVYFPDYTVNASGNFANTSVSTARAKLYDVIQAAQQGKVVNWSKYHNGGWNSPAWGGASTDLRPGQPGTWHPNLATTHQGNSLMAFGVNPHEFQLATSSDGINNWSTPVPLFRDLDHFNAYPTLVGLGPDPSVIGNQFYVYYLQWASTKQDWNDARMARRLVSCTAGEKADTAALVRYSGGGRHQVTTSPVSTKGMAPEYGGAWNVLTSQQPGTKALYGCRNGAVDHFLSTDPGCEGANNSIVQTEGFVYTAPPKSPSTPIYRCHMPQLGNHFASIKQDCEGASGVKSEALLGYVLTSSKLMMSRFYDGREHWETSAGITNTYWQEHRWLLEGSAAPNTAALYGCETTTPKGVNHFISIDPKCEGQKKLRTEGWISKVKSAENPHPLYRCYWPSSYDHFMSTNKDCEGVPGGKNEGIFGFTRIV